MKRLETRISLESSSVSPYFPSEVIRVPRHGCYLGLAYKGGKALRGVESSEEPLMSWVDRADTKGDREVFLQRSEEGDLVFRAEAQLERVEGGEKDVGLLGLGVGPGGRGGSFLRSALAPH